MLSTSSAQSTKPFVHLRVRSSYSMLKSSLRISQIANLCVKGEMPAVCLSDSALFGALEFSTVVSNQGVQPIVGLTLNVQMPPVNSQSGTRDDAALAQWVVIAGSEQGYKNLLELSTRSWEHIDNVAEPCVRLSDLQQCNEGLFALSGGPLGPLTRWLRQGDTDAAEKQLKQFAEIYPDRLYVEITPTTITNTYTTELIELAGTAGLPIVAANDCRFHSSSDFDATRALECIGEVTHLDDPDIEETSSIQRYQDFCSSQEMQQRTKEFPQAYSNAFELAQRCHYWPSPRSPILPKATITGRKSLSLEDSEASSSQAIESTAKQLSDSDNISEGNRAHLGEHESETHTSEEEQLRAFARDGLTRRLQQIELSPNHTEADYLQRLEREMDIITRMEFAGYFLIVADFVGWAKSNDIPVGPGRGSGAASLVAYSLEITDIDPLRFGLLFERFLNPERISMPDFDIDICQERRDEVIKYIQRKYDPNHVAQIITFGSLQPRAVLRDVGRVLRMPYSKVDRLARLIPFVPANPSTLSSTLKEVPEFHQTYETDEATTQLIDLCLPLEGLYRHASTHAAGVVIGDRPLREIVPLYRDPRSEMPITQFSMNWVEPAGLVKFDLLGLRTLSIIHEAVTSIAERGEKIDINNIRRDDEATFSMMSAADTVGVFQFESGPMRSWLLKLKPSRFGDMIAMVALYRPGPMDNIPSFIARKNGEEEIKLLHPMLEPVLEDTYGIIVYQEQVIRIAQELAGYSGGEADLLRRAMGKKKPAEMKQQQQRFIEGAGKNDISPTEAENIFNLVAKFAGYGFNKAHAAAYAWVAYQTAWLKAHFPADFLAASMNSEISNNDRLAVFCRESERLGIKVLPPSINRSGVKFRLEGGKIRYALAAIKNVGASAAAAAIARQDQNSPFSSIANWLNQSDTSVINRRALEGLIKAGAFDEIDNRRWLLTGNADALLSEGIRLAADRKSGQGGLFGMPASTTPGSGENDTPELKLSPVKSWDNATLMYHEFSALGQYMSGHPLEAWLQHYQDLGLTLAANFSETLDSEGKGHATLAGIVSSITRQRTRRGSTFLVIQLSDPSLTYEVIAYPEEQESLKEDITPGQQLVISVAVAAASGVDMRWRCTDIEMLRKRTTNRLKAFQVEIQSQSDLSEVERCCPLGGNTQVQLLINCSNGHKVTMVIGDNRKITDAAWQNLDIRPTNRAH